MRGVFTDLQAFLSALETQGELVRVDAPVDPRLEVAEIHRRVIAAGGPALYFAHPTSGSMPIVTNLFGTARRVELAFGRRPEEFVREAARLPVELVPPTLGKLWRKRRFFAELARVGMKRVARGPVLEVEERDVDLNALPALTTWKDDGGPFLTLPLVYTEHPAEGTHNLGMYRVQIHDRSTTGMHFQIGKGGGYHLAEAEARGRSLPVNILLGGPPALILAAIAPLPENVGELLLASLVMGGKLPMVERPDWPLPIPATCEVALLGHIPPGVRRPEGPFGDHYGYYSLEHDYPIVEVSHLLRRRDAVFPATVVGKPRQEDFFIGDYLQELLSPLFPVVMPGVVDLWSYGETGYHSLAGAIVKDRYPREAMTSAFRILGEGQLALTKFLLVTDGAVDLRDFRATFEHVLARADLRTDLFCFANVSMDTLDYTGPAVNEGSKGVLLGMGEAKRELRRELPAELPSGVERAVVFCGGCLVVDGPTCAEDRRFADRLAAAPEFADWQFVVVVDDAEFATRSVTNFLWVTFTRFEPAAHMATRSNEIVRNHRVFAAPVVIDARLEPGFPEELFCDEETRARVTSRWAEYFPSGMEMGDADKGHLD